MLQDKIMFVLLSVSLFAAFEVKMLTFKVRVKSFSLISNWHKRSLSAAQTVAKLNKKMMLYLIKI